MKPLRAGLTLLCLAALGLATPSGSAFANTAANTQIVNSAKLTYAGGSAAATVVVSVALVPSTPNVNITYGNAAYTGPNTPAIATSVTITATANGPASYTVTPAVGATSNVAAASPASVNAPTPSVTVGASVTTGTSGTTFVTVPAGIASGSGSAVNGIGTSSTIIFTVNGTSYTRQVTGTADNGNGTFTINWATPIPAADVPQAGVLVAEQKSVPVNVLPGSVLAPGTNITVMVSATVSTPGAGDKTVTTATPNTWTTPSPNVSLVKYVRNVTTGVAGTGAYSATINTKTSSYYTAGVTGKPGDVLEYLIVASNTGSTDLNSSAISDLVPTAYVNLVSAPGPYGGNEVFYIDPSNTGVSISAAALGANQASWVPANNPNLVVNVGTGASNTAAGAIPAQKSVSIAYQVTIK
ncbi:hypothetical protein GMST_08350 [Geomonas silvestris]|uniref:DUF11 domain-containing protein n=1 Tax=Geomonas silvestris TaxID=2740184 RepID=A0A6V8MEU4_9BACT|nr:hypothetical protein [Geomonas silvestris]GFO58510.1 hypothetical protein GMST_08350 [Geomonas silvestris]